MTNENTSHENDVDEHLNLVIEESDGGPIFLLTEEDGMIEQPLLKREDVYEGLQIAAPTLFGYVQARVVFTDNADLIWESDTSYGYLEFAIDERKCWTTSTSIKKGIKALTKSTASDDGKYRLPVIQDIQNTGKRKLPVTK